jgi:Ca2+-binding EF-hand superfamily protein
MPPKHPYGVVATAIDFEAKVDELGKLVRNFVEHKSGFGEDHVKSRTLQNILKQFDIDHLGWLDCREFAKTLDYMNIQCTEDEREALFDRYDMDQNGRLSFKELSDSVFGVSGCPLGNPEARGVIKKVLDKMKARYGDSGVRGFTKGFCVMDRDGSNALTKEELFNGLQKYGIQISLAEVDVIVKHFDRKGSGQVDLADFLRGLRGHIKRRRREIVEQAYKCLDRNGDQSVTLGEMAQLYATDRHPAVLKGQKTKDQVLKEFIGSWDKSGDAIVTWDEFLDYYKDLSASIENDDYFELMVRNAWHLSGGSGSAENTSCRRVLVTYKDGRQLIEEIKNDLGIGANDKEKMKQALERQGCRDIVKIDLYS